MMQLTWELTVIILKLAPSSENVQHIGTSKKLVLRNPSKLLLVCNREKFYYCFNEAAERQFPKKALVPHTSTYDTHHAKTCLKNFVGVILKVWLGWG